MATPSTLADEPRFDAWQNLANAMTTIDGKFELRDLPAGTYAIAARGGDGGETVVKDVPAGRRDLHIVLDRAGEIAGTLVGFHRTPDVMAVRADRLFAPVRADVDGTTFRIRGLSPGSYSVTALAETDVASARVVVTAGVTAEVTVTAAGTTTLSGRIVEFRSKSPVAGLRCQLAPRAGRERSPQLLPEDASSDQEGHIDFGAVPAGDVYVLCWGGGSYSDGLAPLTLSQGDAASFEVQVVKPRGPRGLIGFRFDSTQIFAGVVASVRSGSTAEKAGLQPGDLITAVDGASVDGLGQSGVEILVRDHAVGSIARLALFRSGTIVNADLLIGKWQ